MNAIEVSGLNTFYGKSHILHDVSLVAEEGSITTLLGRNGAGKTTMMRSIMGLTPARSGSVKVFGTEAAQDGSPIAWRGCASDTCRKAGASSPTSPSRTI